MGLLLPTGRKVSGELVLKWVCKVLQQFGLRMEHNAGAVTDAVTNIKGALGKAFKWDWCLPNLFNRKTADATGMSMDSKTWSISINLMPLR